MLERFIPSEFMKLTIAPLFAATIGFLALAHPAIGQTQPETAVDTATVVSDSNSELSLADVENRLAALEKNPKIEDGVKSLLRPKYQQAIATLKEAAEFLQKTRTFKNAVHSAPAKTRVAREQLHDLPAATDVTTGNMDKKGIGASKAGECPKGRSCRNEEGIGGA